MTEHGPRGYASLEQALRDGAPAGATGDRMAGDAGQSGVSSGAAQAARRLGERIAAQGLADVSYAPVDSPFGTLLLAATKRGLVRLAFPEESVDSVLERLARRVSPRIVEAPAPLDAARRELEEYF